MMSLRQVEANRRNASRSTGPLTEAGKQRSRRNAVRHGLTAETVIGTLEDAEDYRRFEEAVTADFNPETAVERELVLRLASLLWRLRRAASIETGMFQASAEIGAEQGQAVEPSCQPSAKPLAHVAVRGSPLRPAPEFNVPVDRQTEFACRGGDPDPMQHLRGDGTDILSHLAGRFLHLAATDNDAFERLGRYETALWRQVCQTVFMIEMLRRQSLDMKWLPRSSHPGGRNSFSLPLLSRK